MGTSTFAEYTVMPEIALAQVNREAPLDRACLFACGLSTGLGAAMNTAKVEPGSTCVVFGAGMVGLGAVAGCRLQGAERIVCVDLSEDRLELARGQGATDTMLGGADAVERILELTGGFGADYTFEATGNVAVMRQAVESARMGWGLCTVAGVAGKGETLDIVPRYLITGRRVAGSSFGGVKGRDAGAAARRALARRRDRRRPVRLAHADARRGEPRLRADGGPGRHPQHRVVRVVALSVSDSQLRGNVRLLGDVLGEVLVEQGGEQLLELEERIRGLARHAREAGDRAELDETIRTLDLEQQSAVLRAFSLFFQLANIAEQHHRLRRRRQYEHEGRVPRESLADAVGRLRDAGVGDEELLAAAGRIRSGRC